MKKQTRIGLLLLFFMAICLLLPATKAEAAIVDSGSCGDNLTWTLDDEGTLTISGTGTIPAAYTEAYPCYPWEGMEDQIKHIEICDGVAGVPGHLFYYMNALETVTLGKTAVFQDAWGMPALYCLKYEAPNLQRIEVSSSNPYYIVDENGVLMSKDRTQLLAVPVNVTELRFTGDAPMIQFNAFEWCNLTVWYPAGNDTWAEVITDEYHAQSIAWVPYEPEQEIELFDIDVARMILGNSLEFQFGVATTKIPDKTGYYAVIEKTWADGTTTTKTIPATEWGVAGQYWAIVYDGLAAKEMADTFYVTIYNADGVAVSNAKEDSVRAYVKRAYASQKATGKTMMVDMLNYGAAAQVQFNYGADDLANSLLTDEQKAVGTVATPEMTNNVVKGDNYTGSRFILNSAIQVQIGFKGLTDDMYAIYTYTDNYGKDHEIRIESEDFVLNGTSKIGVELSALVYADARTLVKVTVYNADGTVHGYAEDSIEGCCVRSGGDLFVALMKFADSAKKHLHN